MIHNHVCIPHRFQDKTYGTNNRVTNVMKRKDSSFTEVRCTVCNSTFRIYNNIKTNDKKEKSNA